MLGEIDILVCGNSDPGTSGLLSPFAKIDGLYFDESDEPDEFFYNLTKELEKKAKKKGVSFIQCEFDNPRDYYKTLKALQDYTDDSITVSGTSREGLYDIVLTEEADMDDTTKPVYKSTEIGKVEAGK